MQLSYIGGKKNPFTDFAILSGQSLPLYRALKKHTIMTLPDSLKRIALENES